MSRGDTDETWGRQAFAISSVPRGDLRGSFGRFVWVRESGEVWGNAGRDIFACGKGGAGVLVSRSGHFVFLSPSSAGRAVTTGRQTDNGDGAIPDTGSYGGLAMLIFAGSRAVGPSVSGAAGSHHDSVFAGPRLIKLNKPRREQGWGSG